MNTPQIRQGDILRHAAIALDGQQNAMRWMESPHPALGNQVPLDLLFGGTPEGLELIDELLSAMEYGVFV